MRGRGRADWGTSHPAPVVFQVLVRDAIGIPSTRYRARHPVDDIRANSAASILAGIVKTGRAFAGEASARNRSLRQPREEADKRSGRGPARSEKPGLPELQRLLELQPGVVMFGRAVRVLATKPVGEREPQDCGADDDGGECEEILHGIFLPRGSLTQNARKQMARQRECASWLLNACRPKMFNPIGFGARCVRPRLCTGATLRAGDLDQRRAPPASPSTKHQRPQ